MTPRYCLNPSAQRSKCLSPTSVIEYIRRAGPPSDVSQADSQRPSSSICFRVRYKVPAFTYSNPNSSSRSISS